MLVELIYHTTYNINTRIVIMFIFDVDLTCVYSIKFDLMFPCLFSNSIFCGSFHTTHVFSLQQQSKRTTQRIIFMAYLLYMCLSIEVSLATTMLTFASSICCNSNNNDCPNSKAFVSTFSFVKRGRNIYKHNALFSFGRLRLLRLYADARKFFYNRTHQNSNVHTHCRTHTSR